MVNMAEYLRQLEAYDDLEGKIIRETKVYKVLKAIIKLDNIPQEEVHNFKQRSSALLNKWNAVLAASDGESAGKTTPAATNGVKADDEKSLERGYGPTVHPAVPAASDAFHFDERDLDQVQVCPCNLRGDRAHL